MRLFIISEGGVASPDEMEKLVSGFMDKLRSTPTTIDGWIDKKDFNKLFHLIKKHKWYIHSHSNIGEKTIVSLVPSKTEMIQHDILYHIADGSALYDIMRNGLKLDSKTSGMNYPKRVYLYTDERMALARLNMARQLGHFAKKKIDNPVLLKIDNAKNKYRTRLDPETHMGMGADSDDLNSGRVAVYTSKPIHPDDITVIET